MAPASLFRYQSRRGFSLKGRIAVAIVGKRERQEAYLYVTVLHLILVSRDLTRHGITCARGKPATRFQEAIEVIFAKQKAKGAFAEVITLSHHLSYCRLDSEGRHFQIPHPSSSVGLLEGTKS